MSHKKPSRRFAADNRAVSAVIGFILIFGILVLLLTVYQAQIVPQQNAQTEFEHFEDNKNEMIELRNAISDAGQNDFSRFADVKLGTTYQTRLFTINPPPPAGSLQTHEAPPIKIWNESDGNTEDEPELVIPTKFIEYRPGYNEINTGSVWYEHSVVYLDDGDEDSDSPIIEHQNLDSQNKLTVTALQNDFQRSGTDRVTLELYTNTSMDVGSVPDDYRILIPTRLDNTYWNDPEVIPEELRAEDSAVDSDPELEAYDDFEDISGLNLTNRDTGDSLDINTVGIQSEPKEDENAVRNTDPSGGSGSASSSDTVQYVEDSGQDANNDGRIEFEIENTGAENSVEITALTVDDTTDNNADIVDNDEQREFDGAGGFVNLPGEIEIGDTEPTELNEIAVIDADTTETFTLEEFRRSNNNNNRNHNNNNITVTLIFSDGSELTFTTEDL